MRHQRKQNSDAHVQYDLAMYAFDKYTEMIHKKEVDLQKQA